MIKDNPHYKLYRDVCQECSALITNRYSTSFSLGIKMFAKEWRNPIYAIYGFVRFADEIVDTFHHKDKKLLLDRFRSDTFRAIEEGICLNPVLQAFQDTVHRYGIEDELITAFLDSMEMDLHDTVYDDDLLKKYIYGSAEVVGLMCLRVFTEGNQKQYDELRESACSLGSAFQKVNFLRDIKSDYDFRGRVYFPGIDYHAFTLDQKLEIEADIAHDFDQALSGIRRLPRGARLGVYSAYKYYRALFEKIRQKKVKDIQERRIRIPNSSKLMLLTKSAFQHKLNLL